MLGRHGKNLRRAGVVAIAALKQLGLVQDLLGVLHELPAIFGQASPFFAPDKEAREKFARGEIIQAELTAVEDQEIKNSPIAFPVLSDYENLETFEYLGTDSDELYNQLWKEVKSE